jgi:hypothetical protein
MQLPFEGSQVLALHLALLVSGLVFYLRPLFLLDSICYAVVVNRCWLFFV